MNVTDLLAQLRRADVKMHVEGDELHISAPQDSVDNELYEELSRNKAEIIGVLSSLRCTTGISAPPIMRLESREESPLSFAQERLWFLDQLEPGNSSYNMQRAVCICGTLNLSALASSIKTIVQRHEALRTHFPICNDKPLQIIDDDFNLELELEDLSTLSPESRESTTRARIQQEAMEPFDLAQGPLLRAKLLRLSEHEHVLMLTLHHIVSDGWSLGVLFRELGACYAAFNAGLLPALVELPIQYADFAVWQREWLSGEVLASQMAYWREKLEDLSTLNLPTDRPRPVVQTYTGSSEKMKLDAELSKRLTSLSRQVGVTLFMTLLGGFAALMHRYSGQEDIVVGTPIANRNRSELEDLIGFFVNSLVMRTDVSGNPGFRELVQRVNRTALDAYEHQDLPFEKLVDEIQPERDLSHNPLFQVMFALQNAPIDSLELKGLTLESVSREVKVAGFDLECHVWERGDRLEVIFVYNTDLFDASTIRRMMTHYRRLLETSTASPETPVGQLEILDDEEKELIVHRWNQTGADYINNEALHSLFEQQAKRTPRAEAVRFETLGLDYAELNRKADELAFFLSAKNVEPGQLVGIYIERSIDLIVAILGILKAGAAYVPLDPENPAERIKYIVQDSGIRILLSQQKFENRLPTDVSEIFYVDDSKLLADVTPRALPAVSEDMLAYVIYTSGSTGKPKGVMVPHRAVVNHACWMQERFNLDHTDRTLQIAPINFDISVGEIFQTLLSGGCVVMARSGGDSTYLIQEIRENRITIVTPVPSALRMLLQVLNDPADLDTLRFMGCGGEELTPDLLREYYRKCSVPLYNLYGPTEATIDSTSFLCPADFEGDHVPIGNPIGNARAYILDRRLQPVPIGVTGELHIGGAGLALGYLNQPELTGEKFIVDPFSDDPEARLYKSGDLARYRADGNIEFYGRLDQQVKLRGFRIEPGEIESALVSHEALKDALVIVREDKPGDQRLVAYLIANGGEVNAPSVTDLRAFVRSKLPEYMVPTAFMVLDHFPLNANGKLDRRALPMPEGERQVEEAYVEPRSDLEGVLVEIWRDVLGVAQVGIHDNFFDLGGHSLKATQVVNRIRGQLNVEMPLSQMFSCPTVAELAPVVGSLLDENSGDDADVISVVDREGDLPLSFAQERLWFLHQLEPDSTAYNMPLAIRLKGELSVAALTDSLNAIVRQQEALRSHFTMHKGKSIQIIEEVTIELARDDLSALTSESLEREVKAQVDEEALQPFDLSTGPLLRGRLLRLSDHEHVLLLTMHHIISDGWSLGVLFKELGACYAALSQGEKQVLAELPIQYADFAVWQREWLSGEVLASQMTYWQQKLKDLSTLNLPTDRSRPVIQTHAGAFEALQLDAELSKQLTSLSKQAGATLFMTLLGAFAVLMHRYSGQDDVVIGSPIANRNRSEVEGLIGMFINLLAIRIQVSGNPGFRELLDQVRETALGAYQHQDIPFEKLVEILQPTRDRSRNPLFQVQFVLQNAPMEPLELQGLTLEPVSSEIQVTRFDLECHVRESDDGHQVFFVYNTDLFNANSIRRMLEHYRNLLQSVVAEPDRYISELPMLSQHEQQQLIEWNQTTIDYPRDKTVHELFEAQAAATPDAIAVDSGGDILTYAQLNKRANRLAHYLIEVGVISDVPVVVLMERTPNLVIAQLAVLKAGAAYVAVDPDYPTQRLAFILEDTQSPVLLTQSGLSERVKDYQGRNLRLDSDSGTLANQSNQNPAVAVNTENLAYVIYTSGSTGTPKGVEVPHGGLMNLVCWHQHTYEVSPADRSTHLAGLGFDASVWELWPYLTSGASLYLVSDARRLTPASLWQWMATQGITLSFLPTPLAEAVLREPIPDDLKLRVLLTGGDRLHGGLIKKPMPFRVVNHYGPTENSVVATCTEVDVCATEDPPIGRPIDNVQTYILDKGQQPVPVGVWGELYIGGESLARGYLNNAELTQEKFVVNPFSDEPGARLYRSGDLVRYREDGQIEFRGRLDHQVKLRGFRIELSEVEILLNQHEAVKDAIVMLREDTPGEKRLVAYIVEQRAIADPDALRQYVRSALPEYMVPSAFVTLDELPLSANGKVDRKALPGPSRIQKPEKVLNKKPESEMEIIMAKIWEELLEIDDIETDDMFFDLGGHSLLILTAVDRFAEETDIQIPPLDFINQTLHQLVASAEASVKSSDKAAERGILGLLKKVF